MELGRPAQRVEQVAAPLPDGRRRSQSTELITRPVKIMCESGEEGREPPSFRRPLSFPPSHRAKLRSNLPLSSRVYSTWNTVRSALRSERDMIARPCNLRSGGLRPYLPMFKAFISAAAMQRCNAT